MNNATLINQTNSNVEYYTDPRIIAAAKVALGGVISLDPASSDAANVKVGALRYFGKEIDGIAQAWTCKTLWMNHPFGRAEEPCMPGCDKDHVHHDYVLHGNSAWIHKLEHEFKLGNFEEGCNITFAATSEKWFQPLMKRPQCYLAPRLNYYLPDGSVKKPVTKGSVVTYFGDRVHRFATAFKNFGTIKIEYPYPLN
jgi:ParB family chromosome partitioning protein